MNTQIRDLLVKRGVELIAQPRKFTEFAYVPAADELQNDLENYPHAFVIACLMDRQQKAEKCWLIPYVVRERLGSFQFEQISALSADKIKELMTEPQPLHRFTEDMSEIFYLAIQDIAQKYNGDASRIWQDCPSSATIVRRFLEFKGAGQKIATMAANILVRDFKIAVSDKFSIDISVDVHIRRVFHRLGLTQEGSSDELIIYTAREMNPEYPGIVDLACWEIGRTWCRPEKLDCKNCMMASVCPTAHYGKSATPSADW